MANQTVPAAPSPRIFAVVVTFNGQPWIRDCLDSLAKSSLPTSVVVVDNASTDETLSVCEEFPGTALLRMAENVGFGRANNVGIAYALSLGATAVLLLNQDARVRPDCIERLLALQALHPTAGVLGPVQWNGESSALDTTFTTHYLKDCAPQLLGHALRDSVQPSYVVRSLPAAAWMLTAKCLSQVGGFDPLFFMYCEDDDYCRRACRLGFEVRLATAAHFEHARGFYQPGSSAAGVPPLAKLVRRARSNIVLDMKDPARGFRLAVLNACASCIVDAISALLVRRDARRALAMLVALTRTLLFEVVSIRRHRLLSDQPGPSWLEAPAATSVAKLST